jgi:hypothetical protein
MEFKGDKVFNFSKVLSGRTLGTSVSLERNNAVVVSAAGGEFRVVFSNGEAETRESNCVSVCFVVGQNNNTRASIGFANPALPPFIHTREHPDALVSLDLAQSREWWFGVDKETGWAFCGAGGTPGQRLILCVPFPKMDWTHASFSNWNQPVKLTIQALCVLPELHASQKKFNKFGGMARFEGVTTVSPIRAEQTLAQVMCAIQNLIRENPRLAPHYSLLPPSSFHATTFDLFSCTAAEYDKNASTLEPAFSSMREAVLQARDLLPPSLTFLPTGMNCNCALVMLDPDEASGKALAKWREVVGAKTKRPFHPGYEFHATLAYQLYPTNSAEAHAAFRSVLAAANAMVRSLGPVTIPTPDFCRFKDMGAFIPT